MPTATVIPAVTASSAYSAGNAVGPKLVFPGLGNSGKITRAVLRDKAGQVVNYDLFLFRSNPAAATITDKTAFAISTDLALCMGAIPLLGLVSGGTGGGIISAFGIRFDYALENGEDIYGALVTRGAPTYAAVADVSVTLQTERAFA